MNFDPLSAGPDRPLVGPVFDRLPDGMARLRMSQWIGATPEELFASACLVRTMQSVLPPDLRFGMALSEPPPPGEGAEYQYRVHLGLLRFRWHSRLGDWSPPHGFSDIQLAGPWSHWWHHHEFLPLAGGTRRQDTVHFRVPGGPLGRLLEHLWIRRDLRRIFLHRAGVYPGWIAAARLPGGVPTAPLPVSFATGKPGKDAACV
jgi:ligand-binding SRPBCC domain-containing protein